MRPDVAFASGDVRGVTWTTEMLCVAASVRTLAMFAVRGSRACSDLSAATSARELARATSSSGPLNPGPKPLAYRTLACQVVGDYASYPWSDEPRRTLIS